MTLQSKDIVTFKIYNHKNTELRGKFNRKVPNQMANSNDKTHQTNGQQLSYS